MSVRTEERTERKVCGFSGESGVDWRLVRISSRGEAMVLIADRANMPATSGTAVSEGIKGGRTTFRRWSYARM